MQQIWWNGLRNRAGSQRRKSPFLKKAETVQQENRVSRVYRRRKQIGQAQIILSRDENFICGWIYHIDCILIFYGMFYSNHEICRDGLYLMVFMHVMNYFFYNLASILLGYLK
jgi:hypothetical protein